MKKRMGMIMLLLVMAVPSLVGCGGTTKTAQEQKKAEFVVNTKSETTEKTENKAAEKEDSETAEKGKAEEKKETADAAQKEGDQKTEEAKQDGAENQERKNAAVKTETKTEKKQNTTTNTNSSASSNASAQSHTHNWVAQTRTVHHDEVGHDEQYVVTEAWDEEVPIYETVEISVCNNCGEDITEDPWGHVKKHMLAYEGNGGYHAEWIEKQVGTNIVHHDAVYDTKWVVDQAAYDETVTTGYKCSGCGATK